MFPYYNYCNGYHLHGRKERHTQNIVYMYISLFTISTNGAVILITRSCIYYFYWLRTRDLKILLFEVTLTDTNAT